MKLSKIRLYFLISIPVFVAHGLEEYFTGFADVDPIFRNVFEFVGLPVSNSSFLVFQITVWITFILVYLLLREGNLSVFLMTLLGLILIFEVHHIWKAFASGGYYPGLITAIAFPIIAVVFWKELLNRF